NVNADFVYHPTATDTTILDIIYGRYERNNIRQIIIFDQFEKLILPRYKDAFTQITNFLQDNSKKKAISVVFVFTNEEYINVLKKLNKKPEEYENYFPEIELKDKDSMLKQIKGECGEEDDERYKFFANELVDPENVSMIEINAARNYFKIERDREIYMGVLSDKTEKVRTEEDTMELIFKYHLERMLARLETPELAMIILYSLCCSNGLLTRRDFQNITFAPENTVKTILESLKKQEIIELTHDKNEDSPYILSHEYLIEKITSCCNENLSAQIMVNIEFYCNKINKLMESGGEATEEVSVYYKHTINEDKSSNLIRTFMKVLCAMIVGVCVWYVIKDFDTRDFFLNFALFNFVIKYDFFSIYEMDPNILALAVLAMGGAIFYIYHYLFYFAKIFLSKKSPEFMICVLVLVWGIISVLLSLIINWLWPTWLGIEWILVAILHLVLAKKTSLNRQAADRLKGEGTFYIVVAFLLIGANFALILIEGLGRVVMEFWFVIFFVLFLLIIRQHINTDYMLAKLSSFTEDDS
ncbi:MAG: hypothetical protein LBI14_02800, partial [Treponema sp.]|nr:hypothetical protein [Treponema sp.]